ncbi:MAG: acetyl-CoA carboxylase biotin carboxyl carrier protein [Planctomycetota bacterium]|jgi:acetyl-CoA carboxylase biotin carboxyl carrier protein
MAGSSNQDIFDVRKIRRLVELMKEHDLREMDLRKGDMRIQLRRGSEPAVTKVEAQAAPTPATIPIAAPPTEAAPAQTPAAEEHVQFITSPMVGTFYTAPDPDSEPYVKMGDSVGPETTVCIVEAMKVFNEIQAEVSGKIVAVLVDNGESVEFGQRMFKIDTRQ